MNQPSGQQKWILAGRDAEILPMLERCRKGGGVRVVGLWGEAGSCASTYASIMGIPFDAAPAEIDHPRHVDAVVSQEARSWIPDTVAQFDYEEALGRLASATPAPGEEPEIDPIPKSAAPAEDGAAQPSDDNSRRGGGESGDGGGEKRKKPELGGFALELEREIRRSRRYHLGFTLTLIRLGDEAGNPATADAFARGPLRDLPEKVGRETDSWGLGEDGVLLHLAPEIHEQATLMRRRLLGAMQVGCDAIAGGPWSIHIGQAIFPDDGESSTELLSVARERLSVSQKVREAGA